MPDHGPPDDDYRAAHGSAALFDVSGRGKVELAGPDAPAFLHNLCTNDVVNLPLGGGCEAFLATATAKAVGYVLVYHLRDAGRDALWLDSDPGTNEALLRHFDRYLISEQVELADRTAEFAQFHLAGPDATAVLGRALAAEVPDLDELQHMERTFGVSATAHVRRHDPLALRGYDVVCLHARAEGVRRLLVGAGARAAGPETYEVLRVEAGTPVYGRDLDESRAVMDVDRTARAISYAKGCYLGQEPIVMARDRAGHAARAFRGLHGGPVPPGAKLFRDGKEVGVVTSAAQSPWLGPVALGYLRWGHHEPGTAVEADTPAGRVPVEVAALPMGR